MLPFPRMIPSVPCTSSRPDPRSRTSRLADQTSSITSLHSQAASARPPRHRLQAAEVSSARPHRLQPPAEGSSARPPHRRAASVRRRAPRLEVDSSVHPRRPPRRAAAVCLARRRRRRPRRVVACLVPLSQRQAGACLVPPSLLLAGACSVPPSLRSTSILAYI